MRLLFVGLSLFTAVSFSFAQDRMNINSLNQNASVGTDYYEKPALKVIERKFIEEHSRSKTMSGFRVQVFFGSREEALRLKGEFLQLYPDQKAFVSYQAPNFKLRVGNFRNQLDAEKFLHAIKEEFPSAYVVNDKVEYANYEE
tara:strand:+ start:105263 stop:105691 length:429 start_codon:yes stop_codon:yes gene_type:complete